MFNPELPQESADLSAETEASQEAGEAYQDWEEREFGGTEPSAITVESLEDLPAYVRETLERRHESGTYENDTSA